MDFLRLLRCRGPAGADRPDRLVGHDSRAESSDTGEAQNGIQLTRDDLVRCAALAFLEGFPDAQDRHQTLTQDSDELPRDERVIFPIQGAALRMTDDDVSAADIREHRSRHFAGMGTGVFRADILRAQHDRVATQAVAHFGQVNEWRADHDFGRSAASIDRDQLADQTASLGAAAVHLPVTGHQWSSHVRSPKLPPEPLLQASRRAGRPPGHPHLRPSRE